ncbi:uncharacterized protein LOC143914703 [Arctopsyche grandis]|uniref:uncharacterized protein LOC143914703 n=1 Tax=Arctopsyche grandis TaxID=121162 RepID=UPI00406D6DD3
MNVKALALYSIVVLVTLVANVGTSTDVRDVAQHQHSRQKREPPIYIHSSRPKRRPKPIYGPPKSKYGPPKPKYGPPKPKYGPPKPSYGPPKPKYGPPKPIYGPPKPKYGPPKPKYGPPKPKYGPPKHMYGPPKPMYAAPVYEPPTTYGEPSMTYGEPSMSYGGHSFGGQFDSYSGSFGEPPITSYEAPLSSSYGSPPMSSYGAPEPIGSYGAPKKTYAPLPKSPFEALINDDNNNFHSSYSADSSEDFSQEYGQQPSYDSSSSYDSHKLFGNVKHSSENYNNYDGYGSQGSSSDFEVIPSQSYSPSSSDSYSSYESHRPSYPDIGVPPSDYFGAPLQSGKKKNKYPSFDSYSGYDNYNDNSASYSVKRPIKVPLRQKDDSVMLAKRPKRKQSPGIPQEIQKNTKSQTQTRGKIQYKPKPQSSSVVVGKYANKGIENYKVREFNSDAFEASYAPSTKSQSNPFNLSPVDITQYGNYKSSNMAFSPQNVNDAFTANKRNLVESYIEDGTNVAQSQVKNVIRVMPTQDSEPADEITLSKSISHSYYAGTAPDPFFSSTQPSIVEERNSDTDHTLSPNYFSSPEMTGYYAQSRSSENAAQKSSDTANEKRTFENVTPRTTQLYSAKFDAKMQNHRIR